ncbi:MAG: glycosyltransferase [Bdellovibrionia bacterium]
MRVLAIIVTCRRPDWLIRCIQSVITAHDKAYDRQVHQKPGSFELEIKVGINGKDAETLRALERLTSSSSAQTPIRYLQLPEGLTPGHARNKLLQNEKADWIYFIDDDAFVDPGFLDRFQKVAEKNPDAGVIGGPNLTPDGSSRFQKNLGAALSSRFATFKTVDRYLAFGEARPCGEEALILCNLFVRQSVLPEDPFPTDLICGEENHLLRRMSEQGVALIHSPDLWVAHERRGSLGRLIKQVTHYGISRGQSMVHESQARHWAYALPSLCVITGAILLARWALGYGLSPTLVILSSFYILLSLASAIRVRLPGTSLLLISCLFFFIHVSYGVGVIVGFLRGLLRSSR